MIISDHARDEMQQAGISEEEVAQCLKHGEVEFRDFVKGEVRCGKKLDLKHNAFIAVYTMRNNEERVITVYPIRRKKWQT